MRSFVDRQPRTCIKPDADLALNQYGPGDKVLIWFRDKGSASSPASKMQNRWYHSRWRSLARVAAANGPNPSRACAFTENTVGPGSSGALAEVYRLLQALLRSIKRFDHASDASAFSGNSRPGGAADLRTHKSGEKHLRSVRRLAAFVAEARFRCRDL